MNHVKNICNWISRKYHENITQHPQDCHFQNSGILCFRQWVIAIIVAYGTFLARHCPVVRNTHQTVISKTSILCYRQWLIANIVGILLDIFGKISVFRKKCYFFTTCTYLIIQISIYYITIETIFWTKMTIWTHKIIKIYK